MRAAFYSHVNFLLLYFWIFRAEITEKPSFILAPNWNNNLKLERFASTVHAKNLFTNRFKSTDYFFDHKSFNENNDFHIRFGLIWHKFYWNVNYIDVLHMVGAMEQKKKKWSSWWFYEKSPSLLKIYFVAIFVRILMKNYKRVMSNAQL